MNSLHQCITQRPHQNCIYAVSGFIKPTTTAAEFDTFLSNEHPHYDLMRILYPIKYE